MSAAEPAWSAERLGDPDGSPLVVFVHGGFWRARYDAREIAELAGTCADTGAAVWNLEYPRVGMPGGGWPGTADAVAAAVDAALAEAGGRPVAVAGHSAGGQLALWAARGRPLALAVSLAGVCDLREAHEQHLGAGAVAAFAGGPPSGELYAAASPIERLPAGVPTLLVHGTADANVPVEQSISYDEAARAAGDMCTLELLDAADHFEVVDPAGRAWPIVRAALAALTGVERI